MKLRAFTMLALLFGASQSGAITISLEPSAQTAMPGDTVFLDLTISGLSAGSAPTLGAFDLDVIFDDSALDFISVVFGTSLGDVGLGEAVVGAAANVGSVDLFEVSLLSIAALDALQSDSFVLASLEFLVDVLPVGSSTALGLDSVVLADNFGNPLNFDTNGATISNPPVGVPEPGSMLLWALGIFVLTAGVGRSLRLS